MTNYAFRHRITGDTIGQAYKLMDNAISLVYNDVLHLYLNVYSDIYDNSTSTQYDFYYGITTDPSDIDHGIYHGVRMYFNGLSSVRFYTYYRENGSNVYFPYHSNFIDENYVRDKNIWFNMLLPTVSSMYASAMMKCIDNANYPEVTASKNNISIETGKEFTYFHIYSDGTDPDAHGYMYFNFIGAEVV